ncbi:hypothetical protein F2Q70_00005639 [Brassica cretica]|uniref:Uncharacterized protein n=1 Tax=Brassica cretica TaxID=69181 RepID=A0A8S9IVT5_BRACR|nr:hypothetical protein F2Q70_00005639 [Brassica cretica]
MAVMSLAQGHGRCEDGAVRFLVRLLGFVSGRRRLLQLRRRRFLSPRGRGYLSSVVVGIAPGRVIEARSRLTVLICAKLLSRGRKALVWKDLRVELDGGGGRDGHGFSTSTKEGGQEDATPARWRKEMEERKIWWRRQQRAGPSSGVERTVTTASRSEPRKKTRRHVEA